MTGETGGEPADGSDEDLAAVVARERAEATIQSLRAEGVYDDARAVADNDAETLAVPVTTEPTETEVAAVVPAADLRARAPGLAALLAERGLTDAEIGAAPGSWAVVGDVILADFGGCDRRESVADALLELHGEADTVLDRGGVSGVERRPDVTVVAGEGDTETVHAEHGTRYALDLARITFSPGNKAERVRAGEVVGADERVLDAFAGIGYFALPMARAGASVTAVEINPEALGYLVENAALNGVEDRLSAVLGDCREVAAGHAEAGECPFDRAVLGYYDAPDYLADLLPVLASDAVAHVHAAVPGDCLWERPVSRIEAAGEAAGRAVTVESRRRVKSHSEGVWHVVCDVRVA